MTYSMGFQVVSFVLTSTCQHIHCSNLRVCRFSDGVMDKSGVCSSKSNARYNAVFLAILVREERSKGLPALYLVFI